MCRVGRLLSLPPVFGLDLDLQLPTGLSEGCFFLFSQITWGIANSWAHLLLLSTSQPCPSLLSWVLHGKLQPGVGKLYILKHVMFSERANHYWNSSIIKEDSYPINSSNGDTQKVKIRRGLYAPESMFLNHVPQGSQGGKTRNPELELLLFVYNNKKPSLIQMKHFKVLLVTLSNNNRTFVNVLDVPFTWWKTFTSLEAKWILNGNVVPIQNHNMPYILSSGWLIIYTALQLYAVLSERDEGTLRAPKNRQCSTGKANKKRHRIQPRMDRTGEVKRWWTRGQNGKGWRELQNQVGNQDRNMSMGQH